MRTLLLLRHGKAVSSETGEDHERALTERGRHQAETIGSLLKTAGLEPDLALVSDARRTLETVEHALGRDIPDSILHIDPDLYNASAATILAIVQAKGAGAARILVVGHNPGIADAGRSLAGSGEPQALVGLQGGFPTGALAVFEFATTDWSEVVAGSGSLTRFVVPDDAG